MTIAELLRQNKYRTFMYSNNGFLGEKFGMSRGFHISRIAPYGRILKPPLLINKLLHELTKMDYGAANTNRTVKKWIAHSASTDKPFFLFINYMEAHNDYGITPTRRQYLKAAARIPKHLLLTKEHAHTDIIHAYSLGVMDLNQQDFSILRALYDGDMYYLDSRIGDLVEYVRQLGILDDTILIITSDHGEEFNDHDVMGHIFCNYNTLLHVPAIIRYPRLFKPGTRVENLVRTIDFFPTILDILDINWRGSSELQGHSLLTRASLPESQYAVSEYGVPWILHVDKYPECDATRFLRRVKSIQNREFKYIWSSDGNDELYDLRTDPGEQNNLIDVMPEKAAELRAILRAKLAGSGWESPGRTRLKTGAE